jgi:cobalamin biosynthesis protein CobD/CbiB
MHHLLVPVGLIGLLAATAALCLHRRRVNRRLFAGLIAVAATSSLFSLLGWAATAVDRLAPLPLTWALIGALTLLFALKLYRELQSSDEQG